MSRCRVERSFGGRWGLSSCSIAFALLAAGCAPTSAPCAFAYGCEGSESCIVGRCRPTSAEVVPAGSRRIVLLARDVAVLSTSDLPKDAPVVPFGSRSSGDTTLLLSFDSAYGDKVELEGAFLVIDPETTSPGPTSPVHVDVVRVLGPWDLAHVSVGRTPPLSLAFASAEIPPARRLPLRIEVTEAVALSRGKSFGLGIVASGDDPVGARFMSARGDTGGPRLELYVK